jgi:hypothetical protein
VTIVERFGSGYAVWCSDCDELVTDTNGIDVLVYPTEKAAEAAAIQHEEI